MLSRRTVLTGLTGLAGCAGLALAGCQALPGGDASVDVESGSFRSAARGGRDVGWTLARLVGPGATGPSRLVLSLHGRADDHSTAVKHLGAVEALGALGELGTLGEGGGPPLALLSVDGGETYWHPRRARPDQAGDNPLAMVADELLPLVADLDVAVDRLALHGWSMGGYGALLLATELGRDRVAAVSAASPALWQQPGDSAAGAFDDREDFVAHDVFARRDVLSRIPLRIDCGDDDPFSAATKAFVDGLDPAPSGVLGPGDHTRDYWKSVLPAELAFMAEHLA